jgi:putative membrane-bound dehydrogenase-like protein
MHFSILRRRRRWFAGVLTILPFLLRSPVHAAQPKVAEGFKIRLVAAVPAVQFPCQVATAPDGSLFVAEDPMDQIGPADKAIDRILLFRDGQDPVVFADKLFAVFGMVWHDGSLYVMNMPRLTVFRDRNHDGKAEEREELFTDLGVPAGSPNDFNDHIVSGLKIGLDGFLYISVGDKGVPKATGRDGRTAQVVGGGVLRCRKDGTGLEVYSTGTRNHLEPNLDDRDNLFTYDNTDDGLGWWTRVTHHVDGGYYGYPFDYHDRTDRMLPRMAEYGGGSPCGGVFYGEDVWPEKYRGRFFWAEWGQRCVRAFRFSRAGASFQVADVIDFVEAGEVESFRPLDLALSHDGRALYIADWSMGGWNNKTEKLGRVYAVTYADADKVKTRPRGNDSDSVRALIQALDHPSLNERLRAQTALTRRGRECLGDVTSALAAEKISLLAKRHLVWALDAIAGATPEASDPLIDALKSPIPDIRAQAARALGERKVPIALQPVAELLKDNEPSVRLQALIALGRIGSKEAIPSLLPLVGDADVFLAYSAREALRRIDDWPVAARGLSSSDAKVRGGVLLAMEGVYDAAAAGKLADFARSPRRPDAERVQALKCLAAVDRKPPPWDGKWWGTQPAQGKPPAKTIAWEGTPLVTATIRMLVTDRAPTVRAAAVEAVVATSDRESLGLLRSRFRAEDETTVKRNIAVALGALADSGALDLLIGALRDARSPGAIRDASLEAVAKIGSKTATGALVDLMGQKKLDEKWRARIIAVLARFKDPAAVTPLLGALESTTPAVRSATVDALVSIVKDGKDSQKREVSRALRPLLTDAATDVRNRAIAAAGELGDRAAIPALLAAVEAPESRFEAAFALARLPDLRALQIYLRGVADKNADLRKASATAIGLVRDQAATVLDQLAHRNELPPEVVPELRSIYATETPVMSWNVLGPFAIAKAPKLPVDKPIDEQASFDGAGGKRVTWRTVHAVDPDGRIDLAHDLSPDDDRAAYGYAEVKSASERTARMVVGSDDTLTVWLNAKQVYSFAGRRGFDHEQDRCDVTLRQGTNRILVLCGNRGGPWLFAVALTSAADFAFLKAPARESFNPETYRALAKKGQGSAARGRELFSDLKGLACIKCHAVGKIGGAVGPELSSVGAKYPRDELIASVLYPSSKISSGFEPTTFAMVDGRVQTGIIRGETADAVEILDSDAKLVRIAKDQIEDRKRSEVSLMPNGLAEGLSPRDFADLIAYLETLKSVK